MKAWKAPSWQYVASGVEGNAELFGVPIFALPWNPTHRKVDVTDPVYHQPYCFEIYTVTIAGEEKTFAAGEFSNGFWGFYCQGY